MILPRSAKCVTTSQLFGTSRFQSFAFVVAHSGCASLARGFSRLYSQKSHRPQPHQKQQQVKRENLAAVTWKQKYRTYRDNKMSESTAAVAVGTSSAACTRVLEANFDLTPDAYVFRHTHIIENCTLYSVYFVSPSRTMKKCAKFSWQP
jgi:hypothetical protein